VKTSAGWLVAETFHPRKEHTMSKSDIAVHESHVPAEVAVHRLAQAGTR